MNVWIVAALAAILVFNCCAVEGSYLLLNESIIVENSTVTNTTKFEWDFWRINKPPIIGGLIVLVVGVVIAIIGGGIYYWKKRRDAKKTHDEHEDMHRLEDEDH